MRKLFSFTMFVILMVLTAAPAMAQNTAETCEGPIPVVGQIYQNVTGGELNTRVAPSTNGAVNQYSSLPSRATVIVQAVELQQNCDIWVKSNAGWTAVRVGSEVYMRQTQIFSATPMSVQDVPAVSGIVTGPIFVDGVPVGLVVVPQVQIFELLVPEGGNAFIAAALLTEPNVWYAESMIGATFVDDDADAGRVESFEIDRHVRSIAVTMFHNDINDSDLRNAFVAELFALGATSVNIDGEIVSTAPNSTFEFTFAPDFSAQSATVFENPAELPSGVSAWGIGWHYALQRDPEVVEPSGYTNWIALNAATVNINGWTQRFESGEHGESLIFIRQTPVGVEVSDRAAGAGSFNALALETEDGAESIEFTMTNVAANSFLFNCGDGCKSVTLSYVDPSNIDDVTVEQLVLARPEIEFASDATPEQMKEAYFNALLPQVQRWLAGSTDGL